MLPAFQIHNLFKEDPALFAAQDPHLSALKQLKYVSPLDWWQQLSLDTPGIYILTGGRQIGKSTSCKLLLQYCLQKQYFEPQNMLYMPCDEIYDGKELSRFLRLFIEQTQGKPFLIIIDEITYVKEWDRSIKALADEGYFQRGICLLTGSDALILKEAAMRFPGRRGHAAQVDFHLYPLSFKDYVNLRNSLQASAEELAHYFNDYLKCGGYLRAINDLALYGEISAATYLTFEQWIRGDFLKRNRQEETLLLLLQALVDVGCSQISYTRLNEKIGIMSKDTCIDYCRMLQRMDVLLELKAFDLNKKQAFPRKDMKLHFCDPFIHHTIVNWLMREGFRVKNSPVSLLVESCVAAHCEREGLVYYFKADAEIDVILRREKIYALEVKWTEQIRSNELKVLQQFTDAYLLNKSLTSSQLNHVKIKSVPSFLYEVLYQLT